MIDLALTTTHNGPNMLVQILSLYRTEADQKEVRTQILSLGTQCHLVTLLFISIANCSQWQIAPFRSKEVIFGSHPMIDMYYAQAYYTYQPALVTLLSESFYLDLDRTFCTA